MRSFWQSLSQYLQKNRRPLLTLFLIALGVRGLYLATHLSFTQDQVRDVLFIKEKLANFDFYIPLGPAAASYSNFNVLPFYYYLQLAAHLLFGNAYYSMNILVLLLESCSTIFIYYLLTRTPVKRKTAFFGALLYALSALPISIAGSAWNPNLVPFFTLIFLIGGLWFVLDDRHYGLVIACLAMILMTGLHFQWFVLLPFVLVIAAKALWQIRQTWRSLLVALAASLVLLSPYLYAEIGNHFANLQASFHFLTQGPTNFERVSKPNYLLYFFPNYYNRLFFNEKFVYNWTWLYEVHSGPEWRLIINSLCFWSLFTFNAWTAWRHRQQKSGHWLGATLLIFISMAVFLRFYKGDKPDYFLNVFMPFIFIWLTQVLNLIRVEKVQLGLVATLILISNFILWRQPWYNQYRDYQLIVGKVKAINQEKEIILLNQELETPIRYFLPTENFVATPSGTSKNTILLCQASQACEGYQPDATSSSNIYQYDWVTPVNYGINFTHVNPWLSGGWKTPTLEGYLVVRDVN